MKYTAIILALLVAVGMAFADQVTESRNDVGPKVSHSQGSNPVTVKTGGETIATATVIPSLPYSDMASTCTAVNNYDEICPYGPATSPDVVYSYSPGASQVVTISLCNSYYDTKLFVYKDSYTPGAPYACNDDGCSGPNYPYAYLSTVTITTDPGHVYYIVVDGYGGACGTYIMDVTSPVTCSVTCPPGAQLENEPVCYDNYVDSWNGGCNSNPGLYAPLPGGWRQHGDHLRRERNLPVQRVQLPRHRLVHLLRDRRPHDRDGLRGLPRAVDLHLRTDCLYPTYNYVTSSPYLAASLSYTVGSGSYAWIWVGPSSFYGVACGSDYVLSMDGIARGVDCGPDATENTSWGAIKSLYR